MDYERFDRLTRALAQPRTRRSTFGALVAAVGIVSLRKSARAAKCSTGTECCGPGCTTIENFGLPGVCYNPDEVYCADWDAAYTCAIGKILCMNGPSLVCAKPELCCPTGNWCRGVCCKANEVCDSYNGLCVVLCTSEETPCGIHECCTKNQTCELGQCKDKPDEPDPCGAGRGDAAAAAAGVCCNPATESACGDKCCSKEDQCCGGGANTACCPTSKICCPGSHGSSCCTKGEGYCCNGKCCAEGWVCQDGDCLEKCLGDKTNCGVNCCSKDQYCSDPGQGICSQKCPAGLTVCGTQACCSPEMRCDNGKCVAKCAGGQKACGTGCCGQNQQCTNGQCAKKKRRANNKKKHGRH